MPTSDADSLPLDPGVVLFLFEDREEGRNASTFQGEFSSCHAIYQNFWLVQEFIIVTATCAIELNFRGIAWEIKPLLGLFMVNLGNLHFNIITHWFFQMEHRARQVYCHCGVTRVRYTTTGSGHPIRLWPGSICRFGKGEIVRDEFHGLFCIIKRTKIKHAYIMATFS